MNIFEKWEAENDDFKSHHPELFKCTHPLVLEAFENLINLSLQYSMIQNTPGRNARCVISQLLKDKVVTVNSLTGLVPRASTVVCREAVIKHYSKIADQQARLPNHNIREYY